MSHVIGRPPIRPRAHLLQAPSAEVGGAAVLDSKRLGVSRVIRLNSNEGPYGPFAEAQSALAQAAADCNRYPDPSGESLRAALAGHYGLQPDEVIVEGGGTQLLFMLCSAILEPGDEVVLPWPSFPMYRVATVRAQGQPVVVPLRDHHIDTPSLLGAITARTRIVMVCNPNNPTGTTTTRAALDDLIEGLPAGVLVVLDEAYAEFAEDVAAGLTYVKEDRPVFVLRTFSKIYGLAGARVGYGLAPVDVIAAVRQVQVPYTVSALGQAAALASLPLRRQVAERVRANAAGREQVSAGLAKLGVACVPSQANFIWVELGPRAAEVIQRLNGEGILIRPGRGYDAPTYARVTVGLPEENEAFLEALQRSLRS